MRFFCREDHDEPEDRCPPHDFHGASWDDIPSSTTKAVMFCALCGEVRALEEPLIAAPASEMIRSDSDG